MNWFVVVVFAHVVVVVVDVVRPEVGELLLSLSPLTHGEIQRAEETSAPAVCYEEEKPNTD